ncbi:hypothetical protein CEXT_541611 [Caerostris extrusa]|uniref:Uncharacterized protein n=1 Tax=Caerostris extrusa TaxID=172846 RepID=A0AAV4UN08_CAEEX|nr:hypothetical protein CEXT_541611 [Caerostris extrusa]
MSALNPAFHDLRPCLCKSRDCCTWNSCSPRLPDSLPAHLSPPFRSTMLPEGNHICDATKACCDLIDSEKRVGPFCRPPICTYENNKGILDITAGGDLCCIPMTHSAKLHLLIGSR